MSATLTLKRQTTVAMELRRAPFEVTVDGAAVGSLKRNETFERSLEPGHHTLQVREGRYSSRMQSFDVADGDGVSFRCSGARLWPVFVLSLLVPSLALVLVRES
jgi:hypothetical protein